MLKPLKQYYSPKQENKPPANRRKIRWTMGLPTWHGSWPVSDSVRILTRGVSHKQDYW